MGNVVAVVSCYGVIKMNRNFLALYSIALIIAIIGLITICVLAVIFWNSDKTNIGHMENILEKTVRNVYGVNMSDKNNRRITKAWDAMQQDFECCGVSGAINSSHSWSIFKMQSQWYFQQQNRTPLVPKSCCVGNDYALCDGSKKFRGPPMYGPPMMDSFKVNPELYTEDCLHKVYEYVEFHSLNLALIGRFVPVFLGCLNKVYEYVKFHSFNLVLIGGLVPVYLIVILVVTVWLIVRISRMRFVEDDSDETENL